MLSVSAVRENMPPVLGTNIYILCVCIPVCIHNTLSIGGLPYGCGISILNKFIPNLKNKLLIPSVVHILPVNSDGPLSYGVMCVQ